MVVTASAVQMIMIEMRSLGPGWGGGGQGPALAWEGLMAPGFHPGSAIHLKGTPQSQES